VILFIVDIRGIDNHYPFKVVVCFVDIVDIGGIIDHHCLEVIIC
jgi:hypothetical protein